MPSESSNTMRQLEADVLLWIARLPLVTRGQLQSLMAAVTSDVRRALNALGRHGWIERVAISSADHADAIEGYVLRDGASPLFAHVFSLQHGELDCCWPVERRDVLERIAAFEVTHGLNRFLAGLARDLSPDDRLLDLRALPRRHDAERGWPPLMDGYGCIGGLYERPFFIAWDRTAVPAKHRSARVSAWYGARQYDEWPTILIVCPGRTERRQWERAIRISAYRRDTDPLDVAFTTTKKAHGWSPATRCWRLPREDYDEDLIGVLRPIHGPRIHLPEPPRFDILDRGGNSQTQLLPAWAEGVLAARKSSVRDRVAALRLTFQAAHRRVLAFLSHHPYLTSGDLGAFLPDDEERIAGLLADLDGRGLVAAFSDEVPGHRGKPRVVRRWFVTHAGLELLAAAEGVPALRYAEHGGLAVETSAKGRGGNRLRNLRRNYEHTLGVNAAFVSIARGARRKGLRPPAWRSEAAATRRFEYGGRQYWIRPDGAGAYHDDQPFPFLLEYDRGTMRRRDYMRKLAGVATYFKGGLAHRQYGRDLVVLVVSETDAGERRFAEAVCAAEEQWDVTLPVLLTTTELMRGFGGVFDPLWRMPHAPRRCSWFDGIEAVTVTRR